MKFTLLFIAFMLTGCVSMLPQIKDQFLADKSKEQEAVLFKIEDDIVKINKQKAGLEKNINISKQLIKVNNKEYPYLKGKTSYYNEIQEFYIFTNNAGKITQNASDIKKIELDMNLNLLMNTYLSSMKNYYQSSLDLNYAELSAKIAELNYEKSKIAAAYLDSKTSQPDTAAQTDPKKQKLDNKNSINVNDYMKQLEERKIKLTSKKAENENYLTEYNKNGRKIKDEGFIINPEFIIK